MRQRKDIKAIENMIRVYVALIPLLPVLAAAVQAEQQAPGYGAKAIMFDLLTEIR